MDAVFIYRDRPDDRFYDVSTGECAAAIVYLNGILCAMDREAKITIPVSRWKLMEIGLACFLAALKGKGAASRSLEPVPLPPTEALPEPADEHLLRSLDDDERASPEASHQESSEARWERLIGEMRDLSR
jgi:hypothetical protein